MGGISILSGYADNTWWSRASCPVNRFGSYVLGLSISEWSPLESPKRRLAQWDGKNKLQCKVFS